MLTTLALMLLSFFKALYIVTYLEFPKCTPYFLKQNYAIYAVTCYTKFPV